MLLPIAGDLMGRLRVLWQSLDPLNNSCLCGAGDFSASLMESLIVASNPFSFLLSSPLTSVGWGPGEHFGRNPAH